MKNLNLYYIVSIAVLAVMMLILFRTLKVTGWFERQGDRQSAESLVPQVLGDFEFQTDESLEADEIQLLSISQIDGLEPGWLALRLDSTIAFHLKISDFEDEQVLVELFEIDSLGQEQRLEGCELLLSALGSGQWTGSTVGEFCGYTMDQKIYYILRLKMADNIQLHIETRDFDDHALINETKYLIKRPDQDE